MKKIQKILSFAGRLQQARQEAGISRATLAESIGLATASQLSRYETGKSYPPVPTLEKIAESLAVDLHWLITGKSSPRVESLIERVKPYVYAHLSDVTLRIQRLERERRELCVRNAQGEAMEGGIKDVKQLLAEHHAYLRAAYQELDQLLDIESGGDKEITISYDLLRERVQDNLEE